YHLSLVMIKTVEWTEEGVAMIDQRRLPDEEVYPIFKSPEEVACAIEDMVVRGAPAIGVAAAMGIALGIKQSSASTLDVMDRDFEALADRMCATRPTAVNLFWAVEQMRRAFNRAKGEGGQPDVIRRALIDEALAIHRDDIASNQRLGRFGAELIET